MTDPNEPHPPRALIAVAALAVLGTLAVVWGFPALPATDLPQHEAQVALWTRLDPQRYALQLFTPYLLPTALARLLAYVLSVPAAVRVVLSLALLGLPAASWALVRRTGGDPWWALAGFPLAFGFAFRWGFLSYMVALPLVLVLLTLAWAVRERPTRANQLALGLLGLALFFTHAIGWGAGVLVGCAVLLAPQPERDLKARALRCLPLLATAPIALIWVARTAGRTNPMFLTGADPASAMQWNLTPARLPGFLSDDLLGGGTDATLAAAALLLALALGAARLRREPARWLPAALLLGLALLAPWRALGTSHVPGRFAALAVLAALPALTPRAATPPRRLARAGLALVALAWPIALLVEVATFDREQAAPLREVAAQVVRPGDRIYGWVLDPKLPPRIGDPLLHLAVGLTATHDVTVEPSFARSFAPVVVYRPGAVHPLNEKNPLKEIAQGGYDLVLVHAPGAGEEVDRLLKGWTRVAAAGPWLAYRRPPG